MCKTHSKALGSCSCRDAGPFVLDNKKQKWWQALHQQIAFTKTSTPMSAQKDASIFSTYPVWGLSVKMTNALVDHQEHWPGSLATLRTKQLLFQSLLSDLLCAWDAFLRLANASSMVFSGNSLVEKGIFIFLSGKARKLLKRCCMYGLVMFKWFSLFWT